MAKQTSINQAKYDKKHIYQITLKLHRQNDEDIISAIENLDDFEKLGKQGSIKKLLRNAIYK